jgi:hypothetical protein
LCISAAYDVKPEFKLESLLLVVMLNSLLQKVLETVQSAPVHLEVLEKSREEVLGEEAGFPSLPCLWFP